MNEFGNNYNGIAIHSIENVEWALDNLLAEVSDFESNQNCGFTSYDNNYIGAAVNNIRLAFEKVREAKLLLKSLT